MRPTLLLALAIAPGCAAPCAGPQQVSGVAYDVFATVKTFGVIDNGEAFPADTTPANGWSTWTFRWGAADVGPIVLDIDGQELDATGAWSRVECGNFTVDVPAQTWTDPDDPSQTAHELRFSGLFLVYDERIEGAGAWAESWTTPAGADGTAAEEGVFNAPDLQLRGGVALDGT